MDNIVYVLGAGFSAPLGLPVMSDFWRKSQAMARENKTRYGYFDKLEERIKLTSLAQRYFEFAPFNIEEALSMLEMMEVFGRTEIIEEFRKYICDVIVYYTERIDPLSIIDGYGVRFPNPFGDSDYGRRYGYFVAGLHSLQLRELQGGVDSSTNRIVREQFKNSEASYAVITLNYDLVLENMCAFINRSYLSNDITNDMREVRFIDAYPRMKEFSGVPNLVKLHGSVEKGKIILPTYNKGLYLKELPPQWKLAYELLAEANQIRIIGYSMPNTDSYIKYLLKGAIGQGSQLERVDIICKDSDGKTRERYAQFITFEHKFKDDSVENYLAYHSNVTTIEKDLSLLRFDKLERAHREFMKMA